MTELSPAHEARLEAFKALLTRNRINTARTRQSCGGLGEAAQAYEDVLGELAAAQADASKHLAVMAEQVGKAREEERASQKRAEARHD